ncbi:hypothetical protein V5F34_07340 [Xanthobacter autotrophicus]|uniref:hypothetical protein n=1 Tax=Xanthobacter autotrophicus TaxID=280 RepID=UPI00372B15F8
MNPRPSNQQPRRPRGRPKGTTKFEQEDRRLLAEFAGRTLGLPHAAKLAPFLAKRGYEERDVRRAQKRWREEKIALLREAQLRVDAAPPENIVGFIADLFSSLAHVTDAVRPALEALSQSLESARRRAAARKELGLDQSLPLDLAEPSVVTAAISGFEKTVGAGHQPSEFHNLSLDELPLSLKLYAAALMLHEASLQMAERESRGPQGSSGNVATPRENKR